MGTYADVLDEWVLMWDVLIQWIVFFLGSSYTPNGEESPLYFRRYDQSKCVK